MEINLSESNNTWIRDDQLTREQMSMLIIKSTLFIIMNGKAKKRIILCIIN